MKPYFVSFPKTARHTRSSYAEGETVEFTVPAPADCNVTVTTDVCPVQISCDGRGMLVCTFSMPARDVTVSVNRDGGMTGMMQSPPPKNGTACMTPTDMADDAVPEDGASMKCPSCGRTRRPQERFCAECGYRFLP